ncbi:MAG: hypothetical protein JNM65_01485 [Verrucomicrobiaceae bacterium]|nr:hypothetical protein [Verrucomicrobiaceae bacterium]
MKSLLLYFDATRTTMWHRQTIFGFLAVMTSVTMAGCAFRGSSKAAPYLNGEIIHTTPNEWPRVQKRFSAMMRSDSSSPGKESIRMAQQLEDQARKHGRVGGGVIKVEIKFIESEIEPAHAVAGGCTARILSSGELNTFLRSIMRDQRTQTISYPRMAGRAGHAMTIRSVVNQPMIASSQSRKAADVAASTATDIQYAPVGTILWLCPVLTPSGRIHIETDLTISRIVGEEEFGGNPYPILSAWTSSPSLNLAEGQSALLPGPIEKSGKRTYLVVTIAE